MANNTALTNFPTPPFAEFRFAPSLLLLILPANVVFHVCGEKGKTGRNQCGEPSTQFPTAKASLCKRTTYEVLNGFMETTTGFIDLSLYYEKHNGYCVEAIYHEVPLPRLRTPIVAKTSFCVLPCGKSGKRLKSEAITLFNLHKAEYAQQCASKFLCKILEEV